MEYPPSKKRVGIFGGSFNPPTIAHYQIALEIINTRYVDEVWIVPCGDRADKQVGVDRFTRYKLCELMLREMSNDLIPIKLNDIEIKNGSALQTYDLVKTFINEYPENEFFFVMGTDLLSTMHLWGNSAKLKEEINFLIFLRTGYQLDATLLPKNYILIESTFVGASSTVVRQRIREYYIRKKLENKQEDKFKNEGELKGISYFSNEEWRVKRSNKLLDEFHDRYLGVYGIVSFGVIEFIKEKNLYQT